MFSDITCEIQERVILHPIVIIYQHSIIRSIRFKIKEFRQLFFQSCITCRFLRVGAKVISKYQPNELIVTGSIHDHAARCRSFAIAAESLRELADEDD